MGVGLCGQRLMISGRRSRRWCLISGNARCSCVLREGERVGAEVTGENPMVGNYWARAREPGWLGAGIGRYEGCNDACARYSGNWALTWQNCFINRR